jgi:hypothetical protein
MADDPPILYTDSINIVANDDGVMINVKQKQVGSKGKRVVARIGMSREHAKDFVDKFGKLLIMTEGGRQAN